MIYTIRNLINFLNKDDLVAKFQSFCGLELKKSLSNGVNYPGGHVIKNKFFYYLFTLGSMFGEEAFGILFFSILLININSTLSRQIMMYWSNIMYVGQAMKDVFRMPRPLSPPVVRLEHIYSSEYGMPSTHSMAAVAIPAGIILGSKDRLPYQTCISVILAFLWCLLISLSRLYKGVHSIADVIIGVILAVVLVVTMYPWVERFDKLIVTSWSWLVVYMMIIIALFYLYPDPPDWNTGRGDSFLILGSVCGVMLGSRIDYFLLGNETPLRPDFIFLIHVGRFILTIAIIILCRFLLKQIVLSLLSLIMKVDLSVEVNRRCKQVECFQKGLIYCILGVIVTVFIPRLSDSVYLGRLYPNL